MRMPSLQALRSLEALSRTGSMTKAAEDLNLTRSAISHQLKTLEAYLGFPLAVKKGRGVELSSHALMYLREAGKALDILSGASLTTESVSLCGTLKIECAPGFAVSFLCPTIGIFQKEHPNLNIHITSLMDLSGRSENEADVKIVFSENGTLDHHALLLAKIELFPVCSPAFMHANNGLRSFLDLKGCSLLALADSASWQRWLASAKIKHECGSVIRFSDMNLIQSAVVAGQGISLGDNFTSGAALADGTLIRPYALSVKSTKSYYLIVSSSKSGLPEVEVFKNWLMNKVGSLAVV